MEAVFIRLLNMSITASWLILAVIALRFLLKKAPKSVLLILWALVGLRLVLPFSPESVLSLIPSAETVRPDILYAEAPTIHSGIYAFNTHVNPVISESLAPSAADSLNPMQIVASVASVVWTVGMALLVLYCVISYVGLCRKVAEAVPLRDNLWQSENVASPFVLGLFRPRIYLPFGMGEESMAYVVAHENEHISRRDHWIKPIGFLLLVIYWFNPLIWLAYILLCRDIELACDERVIKKMSADDRKAYSKALLSCSVGRRSIAVCPLAFGEVGVKQRIINVLNYKKPAFWIIIAALVSCVVVAVCFLTNPKDGEPFDSEPFGQSYEVAEIVYTAPQYSFTYTPETAPLYTLTVDHQLMILEDKDSSNWLYAGVFLEEHLSPLVFDDYFKNFDSSSWIGWPYGPERLRLDIQKAWRLDVSDDPNHVFYLLLQLNSGDVYLTYGYEEGSSYAKADAGSLIRWVFKLVATVSENGVSAAEIADALDTDSVTLFDSQAIGDTLFIGCSYEGKYGVAVYKQQNSSVYRLEQTIKYEKLISRGTDIWIKYYANKGDDYMVILSANSKLASVEWTGDHEETIPVLRCPAIIAVNYLAENDSESQYRFLDAAGQELGITNLLDTAASDAYVSRSCLYMNPLSSTFSDGNSGCRYLIGADSFTIMNKQTGDVVAVSSPVTWDWQEISTEEWSALFPLGIGAPDIGSYKNPQVMKLSSEYYLFDMDGELWLGDCRSDKVGMWSVYSLVPESAAGVTWEYTPLLSSRVPAFPFRFNLAYTSIEAECTGGQLIGFDNHDGTGYPQGKSLTVPAGSALYWSPQAGDEYSDSYALTAQISFTVYNEDEAVYSGVISISGTTGTGPDSAIYNAVLSVGNGLMLIQAPDTDKALIQAAGTYSTSSVGGIGWPQHLIVAQGDPDGDGAGESVTVTKKADNLYVLSMLKANGSELWSEEMSTAHTGWDSLFLCTLDGKDYLLRYNPAMFQGECSYSYTLFTLENGRENAVRTGMVEFDVNGTKLLDVDEMTAFADEVNALLDNSVPLLSTMGGVVSIGPLGASNFLEDYAVLFASGASNLAEAAVVRAAQVFVRQGTDFDTIWNFASPELNEIDASRFTGMPLFTEEYDVNGKLYEVTFNTSDDAVLGPIILFVDSHGVVFGSPGRD